MHSRDAARVDYFGTVTGTGRVETHEDVRTGETVRVVEGPFADFNGLIEDINVDQSKVRVLVDIFGRETPVELSFEQIQKY